MTWSTVLRGLKNFVSVGNGSGSRSIGFSCVWKSAMSAARAFWTCVQDIARDGLNWNSRPWGTT